MAPMIKAARILRLILRERILPQDLHERVPEQSAMSSPESIAGFDSAGQEYLLPVYEFNARAIAALAPHNAHILDLGSGSAVFLAHLSRHRPDLRITGIDLSDGMIQVGQAMLAGCGLAARVKLACGDMRDPSKFISDPVDLVSTVFSLHHLETAEDLAVCVKGISKIVATGAALWIFDHARPSRQQTAVEVPQIFTPNADSAFCQDSSNSLRAAWSFEELGTALRRSELANLHSEKAHLVPLYQIHWIVGSPKKIDGGWVADSDLGSIARLEAQRFERLFRNTPQRRLKPPLVESR